MKREKLKEKVLFLQENNKHKDERKIKKSVKERGITLIALVITIIILLILAGVTLGTALGENGLLKRAKQAVDAYQTESQREYLQQLILGMQLDNYSGNSTDDEDLKKLGAKLYKKSLKNTTNWHIVDAGGIRYDDEKGDWYFIKKGTDLEGYGRASSSMLVNYETGEIKDLEEGGYVELSAGDMVYVKEDMIINIDSSIVDGEVENTKTDLEKYFGNGVTLENFNYTDDSGVSLDGFKFDGVDDYIKIPYNDEDELRDLGDKGFTFEFYGSWDEGTISASGPSWGLFAFATNNGINDPLRFVVNSSKWLFWGTKPKDNHTSDGSVNKNNQSDIHVPTLFLGIEGQPHMVTISVDVSNSHHLDVSDNKFFQSAYEGAGQKTRRFLHGASICRWGPKAQYRLQHRNLEDIQGTRSQNS